MSSVLPNSLPILTVASRVAQAGVIGYSWADRILTDDPLAWYSPCHSQGEGAKGTAVNPATNTLSLLPLVVPWATRLKAAGVILTASTSSTPFRLGLYASGPSRMPTAKLAEVSFSVSTADFYPVSIDVGLFPETLYWIGVVKQSSTGAFLQGTLTSTTSLNVAGIFGAPLPSDHTPRGIVQVTGVSGTLPASLQGQGARVATTVNVPMVFVRYGG